MSELAKIIAGLHLLRLLSDNRNNQNFAEFVLEILDLSNYHNRYNLEIEVEQIDHILTKYNLNDDDDNRTRD